MVKNNLRRVLAALFAAILLSGCSSPGAHRAADTLVVLEPSDAGTINPLFANNEPSFLYYGLIFDSLVNVGPGFRLIPWLATSWHASPDGLHWTVKLRHGVRWSDGAPFTSRDVVWTWHAMLDPKTGFPYAGQFTYIRDVKALGPYAVRFDLRNKNALFIEGALNSAILPWHVLHETPDSQLRTSSFGQHPIGTGPYMLAKWQHDSQAVFVRNPHWWHGPAKIPRIDIRIVLDANARVEAMEEGSADLYDTMGSNDYATLRKSDPKLKFLHLPDLYSDFVEVNLRTPGLNDLAVRQAMMYAWDRKAMIAGLLHHDAMPSTGIVPAALKYWYDPHVKQYPYDPTKARALLRAAGWRRGPGGIRSKGNTPLAFTLLLPTGNQVLTDVAQEFQADMRAVGVTVSLKQLDYATFIGATDAFHYQLALTGWGGTIDPDEFTFLDSSQIAPVGNNTTGYVNKTVNYDLVMGLRTIQPNKRRRYYNQMQAVTARTLPVLWGYYVYYRAAYSPRLHLDAKNAMPDLFLWANVWNWRLSR